MILKTDLNQKTITIDTNVFFDLSLPLRNGKENVNAYYINPPHFQPFKAGGFVGSVELGGACNCYDITFNPHGNGTHTECVGHISKEGHSINECLKDFWVKALVVTIEPEIVKNGDHVLKKNHVESLNFDDVEALVIRTLPNNSSKKSNQYSGTNPTYLDPELAEYLVSKNIIHLLVDLPSVDREEDSGALLSHHAFFGYPEKSRLNATITELIYVDDSVADGAYILNLQIAPFESDASPSKPILFPIIS
jgi:kynurenine formamidase